MSQSGVQHCGQINTQHDVGTRKRNKKKNQPISMQNQNIYHSVLFIGLGNGHTEKCVIFCSIVLNCVI